MSLLLVATTSAIILTGAYFVYGRLLSRLLQLDPSRKTPAFELRDDVDYVPTEPKLLLSQHFSAIAAAGPIVGPILAGIAFGWVPALVWILAGSILIGGVHDMTALVASVRHRARSIAEVVRDHMSRRSYILFLSFVWLALIYIIIAFADVTSSVFLGPRILENGDIIKGGGIATSSLLYLILPIIMGLLLRFTKLSVNLATLIFLPLVMGSIVVGQYIPLETEKIWNVQEETNQLPDLRNRVGKILSAEQLEVYFKENTLLSDVLSLIDPANERVKKLKLSGGQTSSLTELLQPISQSYYRKLGAAQTFLNILLLIYCLIASMIPMWLLLQPRGHLGGYFLYLVLFAGFVGIVFGDNKIQYPAFLGWESQKGPLFPMLFITIACGACSGFHAIIASGTTSKQLRFETDARPIGYGTMLLEAMVAIVSLGCVMMLLPDSREASYDPNLLYASGIARFVGILGIPPYLGVAFGLMAFTTFVYDTLDVCTRLGRYILQELFGWSGNSGKWLATLITSIVPLVFLLQQPLNPVTGKTIPAWRLYWDMFGASNQLLAALTLLGVTVWLWKTRREIWVWFVTGIPTVFMYTMSMWALSRFIIPSFSTGSLPTNPVPYVSLVLVILGLLILVEAVIVLAASLIKPGNDPGQMTAAPV